MNFLTKHINSTTENVIRHLTINNLGTPIPPATPRPAAAFLPTSTPTLRRPTPTTTTTPTPLHPFPTLGHRIMANRLAGHRGTASSTRGGVRLSPGSRTLFKTARRGLPHTPITGSSRLGTSTSRLSTTTRQHGAIRQQAERAGLVAMVRQSRVEAANSQEEARRLRNTILERNVRVRLADVRARAQAQVQAFA